VGKGLPTPGLDALCPRGTARPKCRLPPADTVLDVESWGRGTRSCLSTPQRRAASGRVQDGHWDEREQGSDPLQEPFDGQDVGRWRRIRSLYCLICVRHFEERHNEGGGLGGGERRVLQRVRTQWPWWSTYAAQARRSRRELARNVVAEVRSLGRSHGTALNIIFAIAAGTGEIFIEHRRRGGRQRGDTKRGLSPAGMTSTLSTTRHAWDQDAAPERNASYRRVRQGPGCRGVREAVRC